MVPYIQTAITQAQEQAQAQAAGARGAVQLQLTISHEVPVPCLAQKSPYHVLIRVLAVALNPTDWKMITHFPMPGIVAGCDFCGIVEELNSASNKAGGVETGEVREQPQPLHLPGSRVCGALFPYNRSVEDSDRHNGAFSQWVVADSRLLLRVPQGWTDLQGAALGGVGWGTVGLALYLPDALGLQGRPGRPSSKKEPVLVYGGATATGTMACQVLKLSGYSPIAVTSPTSEPIAIKYGAVGAAHYTSPHLACMDTIRTLSTGVPIRHALDCITNAESMALCSAALARVGGRYACLEEMDEAWRTRKAVKVKEVMGFEALGVRVEFGPPEAASVYSRKPSDDAFNFCIGWASEVQVMLDNRQIEPHPIREVKGRWEGILRGLDILHRGDVRGEKLVVRLNE